MGDVEFVDFIVQRSWAYPQLFGCIFLDPQAFLKRSEDKFFFMGHQRFDMDHCRGLTRGMKIRYLNGVCADQVSILKDNRPLYGVGQLADIARPMVAFNNRK